MKPDSQTPMVANLIRLSAQTHSNGTESAIWNALERTLAQQFGYSLFTILVFSPGHGIKRIHSTNVNLHPLGARAPVLSNHDGEDGDHSASLPPLRDAWIQQVVVDGVTWCGSTREDLKMVFEDWEVLWHARLGSVLNIPIRLDGQTIGSLNLLDDEHAYDAADLEIGILVAQI
ncbi:hypothetical protein Plec18170_003522 [Paecilomyces lecythidis]